MTNKRKIIGFIAIIAVIGLLVTACDLFGNNNSGRLTTSVTVNNGSAARTALGADEEIWLDIRNLSYFGPMHYVDNIGYTFEAINIITDFDALNDSFKANNGWVRVGAPFTLITYPWQTTVFFNLIQLEIDAIGIGREPSELDIYKFPVVNRQMFGIDTHDMIGIQGLPATNHPDRFPGFYFGSFVEHFETRLTIDSGIFENDGSGGRKLVDNPYDFITIRTKINNQKQ